MTAMSDQDKGWFYSQFLALCIRKTSFEWQQFVTDLMHAKHGGEFIQVDPAGRGDKGCDGWVNNLMLACYGASRPDQQYVKDKMESDFLKAHSHWGDHMKTWAFVHKQE